MLRRPLLEPLSDDPKYLFHFHEANWGNPQVSHLIEVYTRGEKTILQIRDNILRDGDVYTRVSLAEHPLKVTDESAVIVEVGLPDIRVRETTMRMVGTPLIGSDESRDFYIYQTDVGFFVHIRSRSEHPSFPDTFTASVLYALQERSMDFAPYEALYLADNNRVIAYFSDIEPNGVIKVHVRYPDLITEEPFVNVESTESRVSIEWVDERITLPLDTPIADDEYATIYRGPNFVLVRRKPKDYAPIEAIIGAFERPGIALGYRVVSVLLIVIPSLVLLLLITILLGWIWRRTASPSRPPQ